jgi:pyruvate,water dikinase
VVITSLLTEGGKQGGRVVGATGVNTRTGEFYVFKPTLKKGFKPILEKKLGSKEKRLIYGSTGTKQTKVSAEDKVKFVINDDEIITLAKWACIIEDHYQKPMDIEWAKDGITQQLFILQARPETVKSQGAMNVLETFLLKEKGRVLVQGKSVGEKIGAGPINVITSAREIGKFKKGEILVTQMTDPDWEPIMKIASGIVTDRGGRTCHAAIISRELGVPCVVGTGNGSEILRDYRSATVCCAEGETGLVYEGILDYEVRRFDMQHLEKPQTKIMMNVGNPDNAFHLSFIPNDGVGLARLEFIINNSIIYFFIKFCFEFFLYLHLCLSGRILRQPVIVYNSRQECLLLINVGPGYVFSILISPRGWGGMETSGETILPLPIL